MAIKAVVAVLAVFACATGVRAGSIVSTLDAVNEILCEAGHCDVARLGKQIDFALDKVVNLTCILPEVDKITDRASKLDLDGVGKGVQGVLDCLSSKSGPVTDTAIIAAGSKGVTGPCPDGKHVMNIKVSKSKVKKPIRGFEILLNDGVGLKGLGLEDLGIKLADTLYDLLQKKDGNLLGLVDVNEDFSLDGPTGIDSLLDVQGFLNGIGKGPAKSSGSSSGGLLGGSGGSTDLLGGLLGGSKKTTTTTTTTKSCVKATCGTACTKKCPKTKKGKTVLAKGPSALKGSDLTVTIRNIKTKKVVKTYTVTVVEDVMLVNTSRKHKGANLVFACK